MKNKYTYKGYKPYEYIEKMAKDGKYIEAIALLSGYVELFLQSIVVEEATRHAENNDFNYSEIEEMLKDNSFALNSRMAVYLGLIDKRVYDNLQFFRAERNSILHKPFSLSSKTDKHLRSLVKTGLKLFQIISDIQKDLLKSYLS